MASPVSTRRSPFNQRRGPQNKPSADFRLVKYLDKSMFLRVGLWKDPVFHNVFHRCGNLGAETEATTQQPTRTRKCATVAHGEILKPKFQNPNPKSERSPSLSLGFGYWVRLV